MVAKHALCRGPILPARGRRHKQSSTLSRLCPGRTPPTRFAIRGATLDACTFYKSERKPYTGRVFRIVRPVRSRDVAHTGCECPLPPCGVRHSGVARTDEARCSCRVEPPRRDGMIAATTGTEQP